MGDTFWHLTDVIFVEKFTYIAFLAQAYGLEMLLGRWEYLLANVYRRRCPDEPDDRYDRHVRRALQS